MPDTKKPATVYGYEIRSPYQGEMTFFQKNPHVSGMATEDKRIILNPASGLSEAEQMAVAQNEAMRLFMKDKQFKPAFEITPQQLSYFKSMGADYAKPENKLAAQHTILARILTKDPSITPTKEQAQEAKRLQSLLPK
jgi:hypothetical protein